MRNAGPGGDPKTETDKGPPVRVCSATGWLRGQANAIGRYMERRHRKLANWNSLACEETGRSEALIGQSFEHLPSGPNAPDDPRRSLSDP